VEGSAQDSGGLADLLRRSGSRLQLLFRRQQQPRRVADRMKGAGIMVPTAAEGQSRKGLGRN
jgi:hypothetical protein